MLMIIFYAYPNLPIIPQTKNPTNVGLQVFQYLEQSSVLAKYRFDINSLLNKGMSLKLWWRSIIWFTSFSKYSFPEWNFSDRYLIIYSLSDFFFGHLVISSNSFTNWCIYKSNNHPTNRKRTFFSNALRGIRIKEGTKNLICL